MKPEILIGTTSENKPVTKNLLSMGNTLVSYSDGDQFFTFLATALPKRCCIGFAGSESFRQQLSRHDILSPHAWLHLANSEHALLGKSSFIRNSIREVNGVSAQGIILFENLFQFAAGGRSTLLKMLHRLLCLETKSVAILAGSPFGYRNLSRQLQWDVQAEITRQRALFSSEIVLTTDGFRFYRSINEPDYQRLYEPQSCLEKKSS